MRVKSFIADDYQTAMQLAKKEMGRDAIILNSRPIKKWGILSFLTKAQVEITVAVDDDLQIEKDRSRTAKKEVTNVHIPQLNLVKSEKTLSEITFPGKTTPNAELLQEIANMRQVIEQINAKVSDNEVASIHCQEAERLCQLLIKNRIDPSFASQMAIDIDRKISAEHAEDTEWIKKLFRLAMEDKLAEVSPIGKIKADGPLIVFMIGPTGVGKTTTIAKLAAQLTLTEKKDVALITLDTYRISAAEQLKTYADIIRIPVRVALTVEEMTEAIAAFQDKGIIFVDTAGRSPYNTEQMEELEEFITAARPDETILVLSATMHYEDMFNNYMLFSPMQVDKFIFTKLDETLKIGNAFNLLFATEKPVAYVTNGQNVPDDIKIPVLHQLIYEILAEDESDV